ncbi:serine/threonine protein kinase [Methylotuvimicrobium alcaliphilum]|uniref:Serine/threonine protein kinase n=1 Tax=Methylotuvimicrobium alcaliphilum (strain DSM 19304 / NCIMB 14124 / VKM B-2133 / 20Z) TaxID=1091494 RepID=G4T467_META2|nr:serine/threonine-protein kinase [Methylotuvimicrobium alcaliphilum]CCE23804.1 putative serine/threonine protein kinase [Methylotuvimicrobium alcaliphilum 20Z]
MTQQSAQTTLPAGTVLGNYRIERLLGQGGFAMTYLAQHTALGHAVAIKEYFPDGLAFRLHQTQQVQAVSQSQQTFYRQGLQRFLQEGQVLAGLRHPNIVRILDFMEANGTAYLVMDYEHGETLQTYLDRIDKPLSYQESMQLLLPVLDGLREVHKHQLLHLDIKPDNIFLRHNSTAMLIDFGGARQFVGSQSKSVSFMVNSAGYSPPEQYSAEPLQGVYSDIYSLSATFYRCLSGRLPTPANTRSQALLEGDRDPLPSAMSLGRGQYPDHFLQGIDQGLLLNRKQRPENVRSFQYLLQGKADENRKVRSNETVAKPQSLKGKRAAKWDEPAP